MGIVISLVSVALAASNLLLDFDMIENSSYRGMPKWIEWYSGFSLLVTLVWMYTSNPAPADADARRRKQRVDVLSTS